MTEASVAALSTQERHTLNTMLTDTFNAILRIEEHALDNRLTQGLSIAELHTISAIGLHESNPMNVVARRLRVTLATLTAAVKRLEAKGFVKRAQNEADRRQVLVELTAKGRRAYRVHDEFHRKMVDAALSGLDAREEQVFLAALSKVKAFFDQENERLQTR